MKRYNECFGTYMKSKMEKVKSFYFIYLSSFLCMFSLSVTHKHYNAVGLIRHFSMT